MLRDLDSAKRHCCLLRRAPDVPAREAGIIFEDTRGRLSGPRGNDLLVVLHDGDEGDRALGDRAEAQAGAAKADHRLDFVGAGKHALLVERRPSRVGALAIRNDGAAAGTLTRPDDLEVKGNCKKNQVVRFSY